MKRIIKWIILLIIISIVIWFFIGIYRENSIEQKGNIEIARTIQIENKTEIKEKSTTENRNLNLVPKKYKGYNVAANLKIKKLDIDTCVLEEYSKAAMEICVTKFYGTGANEVGNFCITGHNYIIKNMFGYLYKLNLGDTLILSDNKHGVVEYKIYDKYRVKANATYRIVSKNKWK